MFVKELPTPSASDTRDSTPRSPMTPAPSTTGSTQQEFDLYDTAIPEPGRSYIINSVAFEGVITLLDGKVSLEPLDTYGGNVWKCEQDKGWIRFRNAVSGELLKHDLVGGCRYDKCDSDSQVHIRQRKDGGYTLHMAEDGVLEPIGLGPGRHSTKLIRLQHKNALDALVWTFMEVGKVSASLRDGVVRTSTEVFVD